MILALLTALLVQEENWNEVKFKSGTEEISARLSLPLGNGQFPAVIVIHEWWGLNDQIQGVASKLWKEGYVVLCVDLYRGKGTKDPAEAHELMRGLPEDRAVRDLRAAYGYLRSHRMVGDASKIGVVGFCMGGSYSLSLAVEEPGLAACVIYYGRLLTDKDKLGKVNAAVLGHFGDQDRGIPVESVREFEKTMKEAKKDVTVHIYKDAGHAFGNETGKAYHQESAEEAWKRTLEFLKGRLR